MSIPAGHTNIYKDGKRTVTVLMFMGLCGAEKWAAKATA